MQTKKKLYNVVIVELATADVCDFLNVGESSEDAIKRVLQKKREDLEDTKKICSKYGGEYWDERVKSKEHVLEKGYEVMTDVEFMKFEKEFLLKEIKEVTEEEYQYCLNSLPPLAYENCDGIEMFCMREFYKGPYTNQYAKYNGKFYQKMVDFTDQSTWICNYL